MLEEIDECVADGHSFAFETTLSGLSYLKKIAVWQALGYQVKLWFLSLPNEDIAVSRVAPRVAQGGAQHSRGCHPKKIQSRARKFLQLLQ